MDENSLLIIILASSFSKADLHRRLRLLREYLEQRFYAPEKSLTLQDFLNEKNVDKDDQQIMLSWGESFYNGFTKETAYDVLDHMAARAKELPTMNLYVPFTPDGKEMMKLGIWVRDNVDKNVLVDIHVDPSTFGGCSFAWNGIYHDYSLRHMMGLKMNEIRKVLSDYAAHSS
ncbi:hypothetical protein A2Z00_05570 [Candidatus Gottesmanbacteria bacterium RBG_13_45_10]|uniref:ATP synthase subunit delta n=1 Tax=Candidatus Gottesmanbacteria bacterium RBG_13_45_10 TaxID=1798370 RepID=A0A1F5ZGH1_9BACT|nr:MAG: hypothetical protein A2Z00_05570 [Candidatus Gottesmanbacteria bacterium RBG_13_45_10]